MLYYSSPRFDLCICMRSTSGTRHSARNVYIQSGAVLEPGGGWPDRGAAKVAPPLNAMKAQNESLADRELRAFHEAGFTIQVHEPDHFLGCNVDASGPLSRLNLTMRAYVLQLADKYLPQPLEKYPKLKVPGTSQLFHDYEQALKREHKFDPSLLQSYGSKVGATIFAAPAARFDTTYGIGICARCLTFPTKAMDKHADRLIVFMAQNCDVGLHYDGDAPNASALEAACDSDWATAHSTSGWCTMYANAAVGYASKRQHSISLSSTEAEINAASLASWSSSFSPKWRISTGHA